MGKKVSWRTLSRRAEKANPVDAKKFRARAASLRRAERKTANDPRLLKMNDDVRSAKVTRKRLKRSESAKAAWVLRKAKGAKFSGNQPSIFAGIGQQAITDYAIGAEQRTHIADAERIPGRGEIVGGEASQLAEKIVKLARKRGGTDAIQNELKQLAAHAEWSANDTAQRRAKDIAQLARERNDEQIVGAFLAQITGEGIQNSGPLPPTIVVSGLLAAKVADALRAAGYTDNGRRH
jgi:hypothetical protein